MEKFLAEEKILDVEAGLDLNTAAFAGKRIAMKDAHRLAIVIALSGGAAANIALTLLQHNAKTLGVSKELKIKNNVYYKLETETSFSVLEASVEAPLTEADLSAKFNGAKGLIVIEVLPEDLDVDNSFGYVSVNAEDSAVATPATVMYVGVSKYLPAYVKSMI